MSEDVKPYAGAAPAEPTPDELRELISQTGLSQRRAAEALGMGERMMRYYASGQEKIPLVVIYALRYLAATAGAAACPPVHSTLTAHRVAELHRRALAGEPQQLKPGELGSLIGEVVALRARTASPIWSAASAARASDR